MSVVLIRDTPFGHVLRLLSGGRLLRYSDEVDPTGRLKAIQLSQQVQPPGQVLTRGKFEADRLNHHQSEDFDPAPPSNPQPQYLPKRTIRDEKDVFLVEWYGPDDPENPHNWSSSHKLLVAFQICFLNLAFYTASSIYVPGEESIIDEFHVGETVATLGLSLFTVGYGIGPMLWSPLSEVPSIGRNKIYFLTFLGFVVLQLPTALATNMSMFLVFRFITGFLGSPALATGGATIADMYEPTYVAYGICIWGSFGILGPVMGPIVGGFVANAKGWSWTIWAIMWMGAFTLIIIFFLLPETSAANILHRRAARLRHATGNQRLKAQSEVDAEGQQHSKGKEQLRVLGRAFTLTFTEPIVLSLDVYVALLYGVLFIWFESFPLVFGDIYHFTVPQQGLVFLGILVGGLITVPLFLLWLKRYIVPLYSADAAKFKPEQFLPPTFLGSVALPVCLFFYGWSARASVHWIVPIIGSGFFTVAIVTLFNPVLNYLGVAYPTQAASVYAGNALFRASFGAAFPLFARQLFRKLGVGPGNSLLGAIAICFMPLPYIFYRYGEKIRKISKNARHDV